MVCSRFSMITFMCSERKVSEQEMKLLQEKVICVTNRKLCSGDFLEQLEKVAKEKPKAMILREKDLEEDEYFNLAKKVLALGATYQVKIILHSFPEVAKKLGCKNLHMPLHKLQEMTEELRKEFDCLGASCHSVEDVLLAKELHCTYVTAGHIFETDCKKGLPGRGIPFLKEVCGSVDLPVFAIGGISKDNIDEVLAAGASGVCIMSGLMKRK